MTPVSSSHVCIRPPRSQSCSSIASSSSSSKSHGCTCEANRLGSSGSHEFRHHPDLLTPMPPSKWLSGARIQRTHVAVGLYSAVSLSLIVLLLYLSFFAARMDANEGLTDSRPEFLSCRSWGFGTSCGLWGVDCRPFESDWSAFRCPSRCALDQSSALAVYGSGPYRADSRICRAAIHAGVIGANGGCALYRFAGSADAFHSSTAHGVTTSNFLSWFPKTIEFRAAPSEFCSDLSWAILAVALAALMGYALFPRLPPSIAFHVLVAWGFFYVRLIGQPRSVDYAYVAIKSFGEVFVLLAASSLAYRLAAAHTFRAWRAMPTRRRVVLWALCYVLPYHVLLHLNMFAYLPWLNVDLGGYEETSTNAGTFVVYGLAALTGLWCCVQFARELYRSGKWRRFVAMYAAVALTVLLSWALFPSTDFHFHHTMIGAFFLPITRFSTPMAAVAQAVALGLFVQGYAAWGWSSYLETMPTYLTIDRPESTPAVTNITLTGAKVEWEALEDVDGYSLRLNSVEIYRGLETSTAIDGLTPNLTYFVAVAGVAAWGTDGRVGPIANFTTLIS